MKINTRSVRLTGDLPAIEMWDENKYARATSTPSGWHIEMLSYPGKREGFAHTEKEAKAAMRSFLMEK